MSSNTPIRTFEESVVEGLETNDLTPEEFDREEAERKKRMARAFAHLGDDAKAIAPPSPADQDEADDEG